MPKAKTLTMIQVIDAGDQARRDAVTWATKVHATGPVSDDAANAYSAGFAAGWRDAVAFLKLHGAVKLT